uniref:Retrotransposon Copia-like N-terminal domain-containing protein n=1 Tax=Lactuca sativa TaxID=4236 RepID=A0A9R1X3D1_LACSA|nr:hypothetical protein LSAT_V11C600341300 [Lactuca sativa]
MIYDTQKCVSSSFMTRPFLTGISFIAGSIEKPEKTSKDYMPWMRVDRVILTITKGNAYNASNTAITFDNIDRFESSRIYLRCKGVKVSIDLEKFISGKSRSHLKFGCDNSHCHTICKMWNLSLYRSYYTYCENTWQLMNRIAHRLRLKPLNLSSFYSTNFISRLVRIHEEGFVFSSRFRLLEEMENFLFVKNKIGFINGSIGKPKKTSKDYMPWMRVDAMIKGWLTTAIEMEIRDSIKYAYIAPEMRFNLHERFGKKGAPREYELKNKIDATRQDGATVSAYYTKLRSLWDEIQSVFPTPWCMCNGCTCDIGKCLVAHQEKESLYEFLMGLDNCVTFRVFEKEGSLGISKDVGRACSSRSLAPFDVFRGLDLSFEH